VWLCVFFFYLGVCACARIETRLFEHFFTGWCCCLQSSSRQAGNYLGAWVPPTTDDVSLSVKAWTVQGSLPLIRGWDESTPIQGRINKAHSAIQRIDSPNRSITSFSIYHWHRRSINRLSTHDPSCFRLPLSFHLSVAALLWKKEPKKGCHRTASSERTPFSTWAAASYHTPHALSQEAAGAAGFRLAS